MASEATCILLLVWMWWESKAGIAQAISSQSTFKVSVACCDCHPKDWPLASSNVSLNPKSRQNIFRCLFYNVRWDVHLLNEIVLESPELCLKFKKIIGASVLKRRRFAAALLPRLFGNCIISHTTRAPPVGFKLVPLITLWSCFKTANKLAHSYHYYMQMKTNKREIKTFLHKYHHEICENRSK